MSNFKDDYDEMIFHNEFIKNDVENEIHWSEFYLLIKWLYENISLLDIHGKSHLSQCILIAIEFIYFPGP